MIPFFKKFFKDLLYNKTFGERMFRGFLFWAGGLGTNLLAYPYDDVVTWTPREWGYRVLAAGAFGFAGLISVGQKNPTPQEMVEQIDAYKKSKAAP